VSSEIPESALHLFREPNLAWVATLMPSGSPHLTAVWIDIDGRTPFFNTLEGRLKLRNIRRDSRLAIGVADRDNPYESVSLQGRVVEITESGAAEHLDRLAQRYLAQERYAYSAPGDVRLIVRVEPERVHYFNPAAGEVS
jgi:PPOX class probable F420-dependent enzyme